MRSCTSCGQTIGQANVFCGKCGAKLPPESLPTTPHASIRVQKSIVDPLASTTPARKSPASAAPSRPRSTRGKTVPLSAVKSAPIVPPPASPKPKAPAQAKAAVALAPGARVLVQWANGEKYPGVLERLQGPQALVRFDVGEQRWVEARFVLPAKT